MQFQISGAASSYLIKKMYRKENKKEGKDRHSEPNIKIMIPASLLLLDECVSKRERERCGIMRFSQLQW